jgi:hypothetical protein
VVLAGVCGAGAAGAGALGGVCGAAGVGAGAAGAGALGGVCGAAGVGAGAAGAVVVAGVCDAVATLLDTEVAVLAAAWVADAVGLAVTGAGADEVTAGVAVLAGMGPSASALAAAHRPPNAKTPMMTAPISLKRPRDRQRAKRLKLQRLANATDSTPILTRPLLH